jgi:hypothetical protein
VWVAGSLVPTISTWQTFSVFVSTPPAALTRAREDTSKSKCWYQTSRFAAKSGTAVKLGAIEPPS